MSDLSDSTTALAIAVIALGEIALGEKPAPLGAVPRTLPVDPSQTATEALVAIRQAGADLQAAVADPPSELATAKAKLRRVTRLADGFAYEAQQGRGRFRRSREARVYAVCAERLRTALESTW